MVRARRRPSPKPRPTRFRLERPFCPRDGAATSFGVRRPCRRSGISSARIACVIEAPSTQTTTPVQPGWRRDDDTEHLITREWLITNALGGYASGTIGGVSTRRFHGILIAALPAPRGRTMMFNHIEEVLSGPGLCYRLSADEHGKKEVNWPEPGFLEEFVLERGLPVWRYAKDGVRIEKRMLMAHVQNTAYVQYRLLEGPPGLVLQLRPSLHFRPHEGLVTERVSETW